MFYFLQITDSLTKSVAQIPGDRNGDGYIGFGELLLTGGWIMIPLSIMLLLAIYFYFERSLAIRQAFKLDPNFMNIIRDQIMTGNLTAARNLTKNTNNPVARVIDKGLQRIGKPIDSIEKSMNNIGALEMYSLEKNLGVLAVVSKAAPIFGFVGTLVGMMQLFSGITTSAEFTPASIAGGIYTKLITSIAGLLIGLGAYLAYQYLNTQIDKAANRIESATADFLDILQETTR
ncbi:MAG: MotA/TolQ/ExbB proton channel family protein [Bacteroidetes bacterium]|nr:MotA/TolQ/ExbB proton channel family protein [Bacteroidota bacterium]